LVISDVAKTDGQGNIVGHSYTSTITYLPDKTRYYVVTVKQGLGTVDGSVKLVDGWRLDTLGAQTDSKIPETIGAVTGLIKEVGGLAVKSMKPEEAVGLYRIDIAADGTVTLVKQTHWTTDKTD